MHGSYREIAEVFDTSMTYCANDVQHTLRLFEKVRRRLAEPPGLFSTDQRRRPVPLGPQQMWAACSFNHLQHHASFLGMLEMSRAYLPVDEARHRWTRHRWTRHRWTGQAAACGLGFPPHGSFFPACLLVQNFDKYRTRAEELYHTYRKEAEEHLQQLATEALSLLENDAWKDDPHLRWACRRWRRQHHGARAGRPG